MAVGDVAFAVGDRIVVNVHQPYRRLEGKIEELLGSEEFHGPCYLVRFPSGSASRLVASEIAHVDVVSRLADLA